MTDAVKYRVVMDTNVIVAAGSRWVMNSPPSPLLDNLESRIVHCVATLHLGLVCEAILLEYAEKLEDRNHPRERITRYLAYLKGACETVEIISCTCDPSPTDEDDVIFILCAIDGRADYLISGDNHLLGLKDSYDPPKIRCREEMQAALSLA